MPNLRYETQRSNGHYRRLQFIAQSCPGILRIQNTDDDYINNTSCNSLCFPTDNFDDVTVTHYVNVASSSFNVGTRMSWRQFSAEMSAVDCVSVMNINRGREMTLQQIIFKNKFAVR